MANLPDELLVDVLSRLPVESLVRFKCVCKSWYALFSNPDFVSKHMINQPEDDAIVLRYYPGNADVFYFLSNADDGGHNDIHIEELNLFLNSKLPSLTISGHWNGMVVLSDFDEIVVLCNPATREFRILPESCFHPFPRYSHYIAPDPPRPLVAETIGVGFGYDPRTDDYKVVRIVAYWVCGYKAPSSRLPFKAEVFSLRANSTWREISNGEINSDLWRWSDMMLWGGNDKEQYFDGVYYWHGRDCMSAQLLLSFNMADEVFSKAPLPDMGRLGLEEPSMCLGVFNNESLAMFVYPFSEDEPCIDVWVMKEFGPKESWTKQLTIGPLLGLERPFLFWKNGKELLYEDAHGQLFSYNLATFKNRNVPIQAAEGTTAVSYRKTLFFVKAGEDIAP